MFKWRGAGGLPTRSFETLEGHATRMQIFCVTGTRKKAPRFFRRESREYKKYDWAFTYYVLTSTETSTRASSESIFQVICSLERVPPVKQALQTCPLFLLVTESYHENYGEVSGNLNNLTRYLLEEKVKFFHVPGKSIYNRMARLCFSLCEETGSQRRITRFHLRYVHVDHPRHDSRRDLESSTYCT